MEHGLHIDRVNRDMESVLAVGDQVAMFAALRKLRPWRVRPLYRVQQQSGAPSVSYLDERRAFQEHFAGVLDGVRVPFSELVQKERMDNTPSEAVNALGSATFPLVPTLASLTRVTAKAPMRKAVGENWIGGVFPRSPGAARSRVAPAGCEGCRHPPTAIAV